jgi:class 3 adenylate cyclase
MVVVAAIAFAIVGFLGMTLASQSAWPPSFYTDSRVTNLTRNGHPWTFALSAGDPCPGSTCASDRLPAGTSVVLPQREFRFANYQGEKFATYATTLTLPDIGEAYVLHSLWIWADTWRLYVNGRLRAESSASQMHGLITEDEVRAGPVTVIVKLDVDAAGMQGVANFGDLVVGPRRLLDPERDLSLRLRRDFKVWLLLPRVTLCLLFCFVSLVFRKYRENYYFTVFTAMLSLRLILDMNISVLSAIQPLPPSFYFSLVDILQLASLTLFVHSYTRRHSPRTRNAIGALAVALVAGLCGILASSRSGDWLRTTADVGIPTLQALVYGYGIYATFVVGLFLRSIGHDGHRARVLWVLSACFTLAFLFAASQAVIAAFESVTGSPVLAVDVRARTGMATRINELVFFFILGVATVLDFGKAVRQRDSIRQTFGKFVDRAMIDIILSDRSSAGKVRHVTALFIDIRGFTSLLERTDPEEVVKTLNRYFEIVTLAAHRHQGVVDKFIGDAVMVVWGMAQAQAPEEQARLALAATRQIVEDLDQFFAVPLTTRTAEPVRLDFGIGVHAGEAVVGELGSSARKEFSVIGDTVNVAARLQDLTKAHKVRVLLSEDVVAHTGDQPGLVALAPTAVRGRTAKVGIFTLAAEAGKRTA